MAGLEHQPDGAVRAKKAFALAVARTEANLASEAVHSAMFAPIKSGP